MSDVKAACFSEPASVSVFVTVRCEPDGGATSAPFLDRHALRISGYLTFLLTCLFPAGTVMESHSRWIPSPSDRRVKPSFHLCSDFLLHLSLIGHEAGGSIRTILIKTEPNLLTNLSTSPRKHRKPVVSHAADDTRPLWSCSFPHKLMAVITPLLHGSSVTFCSLKGGMVPVLNRFCTSARGRGEAHACSF